MENGAQLPANEGRDPSGFLSQIIGNPVTVKLNSGVVYKGESRRLHRPYLSPVPILPILDMHTHTHTLTHSPPLLPSPTLTFESIVIVSMTPHSVE